MDGFIALGRADTEFERRVRLVGADDWTLPTPCTEWNVYALVNHVIGANRRHTMLLHGASAEEVNRTRAEDHLGDDAIASLAATTSELARAIREPDAMIRTSHHPLGDRSGAQLLAMRVIDLTVHTWDLARALGTDDTLDPDLVEFALLHAELIEAGRQHGSFAAPTAVTPGQGSAQARLLHLSGRSTEGDR
jgi:uncharacterized protein (TIGR03086 family)